MPASISPALAELFLPLDGEAPAGAGSAAALSGAVGAALLNAVARMPRAAAAHDQRIEPNTDATLQAARERLVMLAAQDRDACARMRAAYRLPVRTGDEQEETRRTATLAAMKSATEVPLEIMIVCRDLLAVAVSIAEYAPSRARGEVAVGVELIRAAFDGAGACVADNLPAIRDAAFVAGVAARREHLENDAASARERIRALLTPSRR